LRADLKDLRRVVGRIDASTDVLARRISNIEDGLVANPTAAVKPMQPLTPIAPTTVAVAAPPATAATAPGGSAANAPANAGPTVATSNPAVPPAPVMPPVQASAGTVPPSAAPAMTPPPANAAAAPSAVAVGPAAPPVPRPPMALPPRSSPPAETPADKAAFDRTAIDRSNLERMLLQRSQGIDGDANAEAGTFIPPLPDPISVVPKSHPPMVLPPQPLPAPLAAARNEPKPLDGAATTGSVAARPVLPIDPTKAVVVKPPAAAPEPAKPPTAANEPVGTQLSPEEQRKATEKMALAMRDEQPPAAAAPPQPAKPVEPFGIDLGGYKSIGQVKKVWSDLELRQSRLAKALTPLARLSEAADGVEIRLVAGPFLDKEQALRTCRQLRGATAKCDTVPYVGEAVLTKPAPEAEHRPTPPATEFMREPARKPLSLSLPQKPIVPAPTLAQPTP